MKVLLTGASGFLGNSIFEQLAKQYPVDTLGRSNSNTIVTDLSKSISQLNEHYDLVIHSAGKAHSVPKSPEEKKAFYDVNLEGTKNLLNALNYKPKNFVFISTVAVYGLDYGENINEHFSLLSREPYGESKILAEQEIQQWGKTHNVKITILRLPLLVGKNPKGNLKTMINAIKKGYYFNIGKADVKKSMVLADDVAQFIPIIMKVGGVYNLTDGYSPSFKELSDIIAARFTTKKVPSISIFIIKPLAIIGTAIELVVKRTMPINLAKLDKITKVLTFNDEKARQFGWHPRAVLKPVDTG